MSNMSYCRFENTYRDYTDCVEVIQESIGEEDTERYPEPISEEEMRYAKLLIRDSLELVLGMASTAGIQLDDPNAADKLFALLVDSNKVAQEQYAERRAEDKKARMERMDRWIRGEKF